MTPLIPLTVPRASASKPFDRAAPVALDGVRALLRGLDRGQRTAVTHGDGPMLVIAGPGTGKTEVITRRIGWLVATKRAFPSQILALTFTERAAEEMQARVDQLVPYGRADCAIHTFHALGDAIIREHGFELGLPDAPRVMGRPEVVTLLREHLFELGLSRFLPLSDPTRFLGSLADLFARAKEEGITAEALRSYAQELESGARAVDGNAMPDGARDALDGLLDEAAAQSELAAAFDRYGQLMRERGLIDHGDQVSLALRIVSERPRVRNALRDRYRYIVVDEVQDANRQQLRLVRGLCGPDGNVTFVGDDDQAIYSFRGALGDELAHLRDSHPTLRSVALRRNHRSLAPILEAARSLIRHNDPMRLEVSEGLDKSLIATRRRRHARPVHHLAFDTAPQEADHVARDIRARIDAGQGPDSIAVLLRTNADAEQILASLDALGVPRRFSGAPRLLGRPEVRTLLSLLRAVADPDDSVDLYGVATAMPYSMGGEDLTRLVGLARRRRRSIWWALGETLEQPGLLRLKPATRHAMSRLMEDLQAAIAESHVRPTTDVLYGHLRRSGMLASLVERAERGDDLALRQVARFFESLRARCSLVSDPRIASVVPLLTDLEAAGDDPGGLDDGPEDGVSVLTVHQAKGLEFSTVFVMGLADGRFPVQHHRASLSLPAALLPFGEPPGARGLAEERRLLYVAMTRARDELILTHASALGRGTSRRRRRPSVFICEALGAASLPEGVASLAATGRDEPEPRPAPPGRGALRGPAQPLELSYTQVDDYLACPLRYRLRHVLGVPTPPNHALVVGNALHQAVAAANLARMRGRAASLEGALEVFATHWQSEGFLSREHEEARFSAGRAAIEGFIAREESDAARRVLAVERPFTTRVGPAIVRGRFDVVFDGPAGAIVTDYKSGSVPDQRAADAKARASLQLQVYAMAWEGESGRPPIALELHFLESDIIGRTAPDGARSQKARDQVAEAAAGIRAGRFEPTPGFPACAWCPFRAICPAAA